MPRAPGSTKIQDYRKWPHISINQRAYYSVHQIIFWLSVIPSTGVNFNENICYTVLLRKYWQENLCACSVQEEFFLRVPSMLKLQIRNPVHAEKQITNGRNWMGNTNNRWVKCLSWLSLNSQFDSLESYETKVSTEQLALRELDRPAVMFVWNCYVSWWWESWGV